MTTEVKEMHIKIMLERASMLRKQIENAPWYKFRTLSKLRQERESLLDCIRNL